MGPFVPAKLITLSYIHILCQSLPYVSHFLPLEVEMSRVMKALSVCVFVLSFTGSASLVNRHKEKERK